MATKTSIWFDGDEYRWDDERNDYVFKTVVDGKIVRLLYQIEQERRWREDLRNNANAIKAAEEVDSESNPEQYGKDRVSQVFKDLTLLYAKTGDSRYSDAAKSFQETLDADKVRYAASGVKGVQGVKGISGEKPSVWFNGYKYEYDSGIGDYVRWVKMGNISRPFTLRSEKKKVATQVRKNRKEAREQKKKAKKIIGAAQRSVKGKTKGWSEAQTTKNKATLADHYTCMTFGNHLRKTWASHAITVALMKKHGYSQDKIDRFTNAAIDHTMDVFRRAYKHNGGVEAAISVMRGFSPAVVGSLQKNMGSLKKDRNGEYAEKLIRNFITNGAKTISGNASSNRCQIIASQLLSSYNNGLKQGYVNLSRPRDAETCRKAFTYWKQKQKEKANVASKPTEQPTSTDGRTARPSKGTGSGTSGGSGIGTPKAVEKGNDARGTSGSGTSDQRDRVVTEPAKAETKEESIEDRIAGLSEEDVTQRVFRLKKEWKELHRADLQQKRHAEVSQKIKQSYDGLLKNLRESLKNPSSHVEYLTLCGNALRLSYARKFEVLPELRGQAFNDLDNKQQWAYHDEIRKEGDVYARLDQLYMIGTPRNSGKEIEPYNAAYMDYLKNIPGFEHAPRPRNMAIEGEFKWLSNEVKSGYKGREFSEDEKSEIKRTAREVALRCYDDLKKNAPIAKEASVKLKEYEKRKAEIVREREACDNRLKEIKKEKEREAKKNMPRKLSTFVAGAMENKRNRMDSEKREAKKDSVLRNYRELKKQRANQSQTTSEPVSEPPKVEEPKTVEPPKPEPPKPQKEAPKAPTPKQPKPEPEQPKPAEPSKPAPKKKEEPKDEKQKKSSSDANVGKGLDAAAKSILRFVGQIIGDGKIDNYEDFLKDAARELSSVHNQTVSPVYCDVIFSDLEKDGYMQRGDDDRLLLSQKGRDALRNIGSRRKTTTKK